MEQPDIEFVDSIGCADHDHPPLLRVMPDAVAFDGAARLFRAMGDAPRLRILSALMAGECCVTQLMATLGEEKFSTVSQRLRILHTEGLVTRRRVKSHIYYALADAHVTGLIANALDHARELNQ